MFSKLVVITALASTSATSLRDRSPEQKLWDSFKLKYNKKYGPQEEQTRFGFFLENLKMAELRNIKEKRAGGTAVHGVTKFSDLSQSEFESQYLTADVTMKSKQPKEVYVAPKRDTPAEDLIDWSGVLTTDVKDQVSFSHLNFIF